MGDNGENGQDQGGSGGGALVEGLHSEHHRRETLAFLRRAVLHGWKIDAEWFEHLPKIAAQIAADATVEDRARVAALRVLLAMARDRVTATGILDHIERLDSGEATERVEHVEAERRRAIMADPKARHMALKLWQRGQKLLAADGSGDNGKDDTTTEAGAR